MVDCKIDYVTHFSLDGSSGKAKGTKEKVRSFKEKWPSFQVISAETSGLLRLAIEFVYVLRVLSSERTPDVVILRVNFPTVVMLLKLLYNCEIIMDVHSIRTEETKKVNINNIIKYLVITLSYYDRMLASHLADGIVFNNGMLEKEWSLRQYYDVKSTVIRNGSDPSKFFPGGKVKCRKELGISTKKAVYLFVGSVSPWHGVDQILEASKKVNSSVIYIVGGRGEYYKKMKSKHDSGNVYFVGRVSNSEARKYMASADMALLPVNKYRASPGSPLKLFDYLMCGLPVIVEENTLGYSDVVKEANAGITLNFRNGTALSSALNNKPFHQFSRKRISRWARNNVSWDSRAEEWADFAGNVTKCNG